MTDPYSASPPGDGQDPSTHASEIKTAAKDAGQAADSAISDAKAKLQDRGTEKIDAASTGAGDSLRQVADQLRQAGDNLGEDQAWAKQAFSQGAQGMERVSGYLRDGKFQDFSRDLQTFARSNPAAFLAGSVALGFLAAQVAKTAAEHAAEPTSAPLSQPSTASAWDEPRSFAPAQNPSGGANPGETL